MTTTPERTPTLKRRAAMLAFIIIAQSLCAMFFLADVVVDYALGGGERERLHLIVETIAAVSLVGGWPI